MVRTDLLSASKVKKLQELTASLSTRTVHAPQTSDSQERLVPVKQSLFRRVSKSVSLAGTVPLQAFPFTDSVTLKV
jgi:hypothetical protein